MAAKNVIVLFDKSGTPQIANKPRKNERISNSRAMRIARLLTGLPVSIFVSGVNAADPEYRKIIGDYERFGNKARKEYRQVRERPIAQIMHSRVLNHCLFHSITGYFEAGGGDAAFSVFIDNWSIPQNDVEIYLEYSATLLARCIVSLCAKYHKGRPASIARLQLLDEDSHRKRFVDVVASIFGRAYLKTDDPKYSREAADILQGNRIAQFGDATGHSIRIMQETMNTPSPAADQRR